jgi:hypothetical protein
VKSRQYWPAHTHRRPTAPNGIKVAFVRVSPTTDAARNTSTQAAKISEVTGAARSTCQTGGRGGRGGAFSFTVWKDTLANIVHLPTDGRISPLAVVFAALRCGQIEVVGSASATAAPLRAADVAVRALARRPGYVPPK